MLTLGPNGLEPLTLRLSSVYSNQLSYDPFISADSGTRTRTVWLEARLSTINIYPQFMYNYKIDSVKVFIYLSLNKA